MNELLWVALLLGLGLMQVFLASVWLPLGAVDWLLVAVVHQALRGSFRRAVILGAVAGLIQDGLVSGELVGLHGFAKTGVAAVIASVGTFLVIRGPLAEAALSGLASVLETMIVIGWLVLLGRVDAAASVSVVAGRALATASATAMLLLVAARLRARRRRRRSRFVSSSPEL